MLRPIAAFASAVFLLNACARTSMTSLAAPELAGRTFQRIVVAVRLDDLGERKEFELLFRSAYTTDSMRFLPSFILFFPGRTYAQVEMDSILSANRIDALLIISQVSAGVAAEQSGPQPSSFETQCRTNPAVPCMSGTGPTSGPTTVSRPWAEFQAQIFDRASGKAVWVASASTGGNAFANRSTIRASMAKQTIAQLQKDRLVP